MRRMDYVLKEEEVDSHLVLILFGDVRYAGKEALLVSLAVELVAEVGEIQLERRIGDDEVELPQVMTAILFMIGL